MNGYEPVHRSRYRGISQLIRCSAGATFGSELTPEAMCAAACRNLGCARWRKKLRLYFFVFFVGGEFFFLH